jgi:hypothetical protein
VHHDLVLELSHDACVYIFLISGYKEPDSKEAATYNTIRVKPPSESATIARGKDKSKRKH